MAVWVPSPWPKMSMALAQCEQVNVAHVLDDAENFYIDLAEHLNGFADIGKGDSWEGVVTTTAPVTATV